MRITLGILVLLLVFFSGCRTPSSEPAPPFQRAAVAEGVSIPPLEDRPPPRFTQVSYSVSGEGTINQVDLILKESRAGYDVFEVVNHMPHGRSSRHWYGYAGLMHLLVNPDGIPPGSTRQTQSKVIDVETWEGSLFPMEIDNRLDVMMTTRDTVYELRTGRIAERENTCLFAFRVIEELDTLPPFYEDLEGPFYLVRQKIDCTEGEPAFREIVFAPSLGCPVEIRSFDTEGNVVSYRRLQHLVPLNRKRQKSSPRQSR